MRARPDNSVGWLLNGVRYASEDAYLVALDAWAERRARLMAAIMAEREEDG